MNLIQIIKYNQRVQRELCCDCGIIISPPPVYTIYYIQIVKIRIRRDYDVLITNTRLFLH